MLAGRRRCGAPLCRSLPLFVLCAAVLLWARYLPRAVVVSEDAAAQQDMHDDGAFDTTVTELRTHTLTAPNLPKTVHRVHSNTDEGTWFDPVQVLAAYWATHADELAKMAPPVGTDFVPLPSTSSGPPLCGAALLDALGLQFHVEDGLWAHTGGDDGLWNRHYVVTLSPSSAVFANMSLVGRALGKDMFHGSVTREDPRTFRVVFGPFYDKSSYDVDILVTWVGPFFVGQRWILPNRNDNPAFEEKKRKCLALTQQGSCGRFGHTLMHEVVSVVSEAASNARKPLCTASDVGVGGGYWQRVPPTPLLHDPVGLNFLNESVWQWQQRQCRLRIFQKDDAARCFQEKGVKHIGLFGDSMMVELVNQFATLFDAKVTQTKAHKLRVMEVRSAEGVWVRFSRSYTTREGRSVIARPATILKQLESTGPSVIIGNFAVLHWQQNMMPLAAWYANLAEVARLMNHPSKPWAGRAYYMGPTLIQMGRTQGLEPSRTNAFARAAQEVLARGSPAFHMIEPYELSVSRRESAYDGQHWACYHTYGGVAQSILQLWLNQFCN